jgi:hypothetical protein
VPPPLPVPNRVTAVNTHQETRCACQAIVGPPHTGQIRCEIGFGRWHVWDKRDRISSYERVRTSAKASPTKTPAWSEMMYFVAPCSCMAHSSASMMHSAFGPSNRTTHTTLREKWSMATRIWAGHRPQHRTVVVSMYQTWLGYQAGIERKSGFSCVSLAAARGAGVVVEVHATKAVDLKIEESGKFNLHWCIPVRSSLGFLPCQQCCEAVRASGFCRGATSR